MAHLPSTRRANHLPWHICPSPAEPTIYHGTSALHAPTQPLTLAPQAHAHMPALEKPPAFLPRHMRARRQY
eukprot:358377-Chlamydomonas_euryale.AAC.4